MKAADDARLLRVVHGDATPEEIAALVAVLTRRRVTTTDQSTGTGAPSRWSWRPALLRAPLSPGPGAWVSSAHPR